MNNLKMVLVGALAAALGGASALPALAEGVKQSQTFSLQPGWNAVYITVAPDETPDEIFRDWPVECVARYDPAVFYDTKQYSGTTSTEGARTAGFVMWRRTEGPLSPLTHVDANCVYVCFSTNPVDRVYAQTLYGRPGAPRITWHPSSTNDSMNYVGILTQPGMGTTVAGWFDGANLGNSAFYRLYGNSVEKPSLGQIWPGESFTNGETLVVSVSRTGNWSGVFHVSPMDGVDFSTYLTKRTVTVRNDSTQVRTVRVTLGSGAAEPPSASPTVPLGLKWRDGESGTNAWQDLSTSTTITRELAVGEEFLVEMALDRSQYAAVSAGQYYGALLHVDDATADGSNLRVTVPVEVTSDGGEGASHAWPKGLWLASGVFNQVNYMKGTGTSSATSDPRAGGKVKVRLPMYVDSSGKMTLLQRVTYGVDTNGTPHVYSGALTTVTNYPVAILNARRISSAVLPIDRPCITARDGDVFGGRATFPFVVGERSRANPLRHALHPMHDGLSADYASLAPSGDNLENYVTSTVKPELFSITNRISFAWDEAQGTAWNPEEMCSGTLTWELDGVRHEGTVRMTGAFTMKRISSASLDR